MLLFYTNTILHNMITHSLHSPHGKQAQERKYEEMPVLSAPIHSLRQPDASPEDPHRGPASRVWEMWGWVHREEVPGDSHSEEACGEEVWPGCIASVSTCNGRCNMWRWVLSTFSINPALLCFKPTFFNIDLKASRDWVHREELPGDTGSGWWGIVGVIRYIYPPT